MTASTGAITNAELLRLRMHALGLSHPDPGTSRSPAPEPGASPAGVDAVTAVVSHLGAVQGQDWRASQWAVGLRAAGSSVADLVEAFNSGKIVRSWPMRGTVHLTLAEDIGWIQALTGKRIVAGAAQRRAFLGISDAVLDRLVATTLEALRGGVSLSREELSSVWSEAGIEWQSNWRYHLIWWMCQNNLTTFGPVPLGSNPAALPEPRLVLASEWIERPRSLSGDEALEELASRYVQGRGAVRQKDFSWWSMLPMGEAKRGLELAADAGRVERARVAEDNAASGAVWIAPHALDVLCEQTVNVGLSDAHLLPAFDEHLLGFTIRDAQLDPQHFARVVPGKNGMFLGTVVRGGRTIGTWKRAVKPDRDRRVTTGDIDVSSFPGERISHSELSSSVARWARFYGVEPPSVRT